MSFVRLCMQAFLNANRSGIQRVIAVRGISHSLKCFQEQQQEEHEETTESENNQVKVHPSSDRSKVIPVETSIKYLQSDAYKETYGDKPIWIRYRRNFKGQYPPKKTRKTCIRYDALATSNPCPICRDELLVLDHKNTELLKQFISPYNGEIISYEKTGLCQKQHRNLLVSIIRAKDYGTISFDLPFRSYDYSEWYNPDEKSKDPKEAEKKLNEVVNKFNEQLNISDKVKQE